MTTTAKSPKIEHIVLSGGNIYGFTFYGILKTLHQNGVWELSNIKSIYATSVGSIVSTIIALDYDWDTLDRYLIQRPLGELINFDMNNILGCIQNCGFFNLKLIEEYFYNLFKGKDMSPTITMGEFYQATGIELHFFTTKIMGFELIDLSYKTHPDWKMVEAIYASSAIFPFLSPLFKDGQLYSDGGFLLNNPLSKCISNCNDELWREAGQAVSDELNTIVKKEVKHIDSILEVHLKEYVVSNETKYLSSETYNIFSFITELIENILQKISLKKTEDEYKIKYTFEVDTDYMNVLDFTIYTKMENRKELIDYGIKLAEEFLQHEKNESVTI